VYGVQIIRSASAADLGGDPPGSRAVESTSGRLRAKTTGDQHVSLVSTELYLRLPIWRNPRRLCRNLFGPANALKLWRSGPESNRHTRICSPLHHHSATGPLVQA
jgi:hypothetical protein